MSLFCTGWVSQDSKVGIQFSGAGPLEQGLWLQRLALKFKCSPEKARSQGSSSWLIIFFSEAAENNHTHTHTHTHTRASLFLSEGASVSVTYCRLGGRCSINIHHLGGSSAALPVPTWLSFSIIPIGAPSLKRGLKSKLTASFGNWPSYCERFQEISSAPGPGEWTALLPGTQ